MMTLRDTDRDRRLPRRADSQHRPLSVSYYRVMLVVWQLGWVEIDLGYYTTCWAAGVMAEWAELVGRLVELENLSQLNQLPDHQHHPVLSSYKDLIGCSKQPNDLANL